MLDRSGMAKTPDTILLISALGLALLGTAMVFSSSHRVAEIAYGDPLFFLKKQLLFVVVGIVVMMVASNLPLQKMRAYIYPALVLLGVLLIFVFFPHVGGKGVKGAARWIRIGPFSLHVSELVKLVAVFFLADYLTRKQEAMGDLLRGMLFPLLILSPLLALILFEPDFGCVAIICAVALTMMFLGGIRKRHMAIVGLPVVVGGAFLLVAQPYRVARLLAFINPWENPSGYQIKQSLMSYGSGGAFGVGIGDGMQKLYYLPEAHTDFILSMIAEEMGLVSVAVVLVLFFIIIARGTLIALNSSDRFNSLLAAGITLLIGAQAVINIASSMGLMPPKGLALPLVSYGGTALLVNMMAVGVLLNISTSVREKSIANLLETIFKRGREQSWERRTQA